MSRLEGGVRIKVACCNWSHADAPHAAVYFTGPGTDHWRDAYFGTWAEAMAFADRLAESMRGAA